MTPFAFWWVRVTWKTPSAGLARGGPDPTLSLRRTSDDLVIRTTCTPLRGRATIRTCDPTRLICASTNRSLRSATPRAGTGLEYAASAQRPRRAAALDAEQAEALSRLIATPPIAAPRAESGQAYVRWADGVTYICPWQTRLRSWLELARLRSTDRPLLASAFTAGQADEALRDFACWQGQASRCGCSSSPVRGPFPGLVRALRPRGAVARAGPGR